MSPGFLGQQQQQPQQQPPPQQSAFVMHHPSYQQPHLSLQSPNVAAAAAAAGVQLHSPGKRRESLASLSSHDSNMKEIEESNAAIAMLRLKKNIEQKEEFMRRPNLQQQQQQQMSPQMALHGQPQQQMPSRRSSGGADVNGQVMPREFYSRPKKLQRPMWPPSLEEQQQQQQQHQQRSALEQTQFVPIHSPTSSTAQQQKMQQSKLMKSKCREQFFNMIQQQQQQHQHPHDGVDEDLSSKCEEYPIPANGLHIVSEKTKLFESGRPLSPDGSCVDRTLLYKSELSRLNQKVATPGVALRKKEYEQINEHSDYSRLSTDTETIVSDTASVGRLQSPPIVVGNHQHPTEVYNQSSSSSHTVPVVVVRREPKQANADGLGVPVSEDDRRMRRISYLRATANDTNLEINNNSSLLTSSGGSGSGSGISSNSANSSKRTALAAAEYAENDRAMAMNVISDTRDKRRHGRQMGGGGEDAEEAIKDTNTDEEMTILMRGNNGDKRRTSSASQILALHEGPMQIKITLIEGKRSHDRSWKNVWAELKGNKLNLTVQRDGKPNQVCLLWSLNMEGVCRY